MRKQFKNIPIGSIITPCVKRGACINFKRTAHLRKFIKVDGCSIKRLKDNLELRSDEACVYWNIVKLGCGPTAFRFTSWSKF